MHQILRKALVGSLATALGVGVVAAVAFAGPGNSPAITFASPSPGEGATLTSRSATFAFSYNRTTKQTRSLVCSLSGPSTSLSAPCDDLVNITGGARADKSYSNLANGSYTVTAKLTLTDGGTASATRQFTINAPRYVYWTDTGATTIGRANLDGSSPDQNFITGASLPGGITVDRNYVYWTNEGTGSIGRANLDGSNVNQNFIPGVGADEGVAVDSNYIYWTARVPGTFGVSIGRAKLDGSSPDASFINTSVWGDFLAQVAVDGNYIYWADVSIGTVGRANLDGTNPQQVWFQPGFSRVAGVVVDANYIYTSLVNLDSIGRANRDGTSENNNFISSTNAQGLAVASDYIYWAGDCCSISRANLDGTSPSFIIGAGPFPEGVAVDAE